MAPRLAGGEFISGWDGLTVGDLFERIRISMPQNAPGSLSGQQNADILAFMFSVNKFPTGSDRAAQRGRHPEADQVRSAKSPNHPRATHSASSPRYRKMDHRRHGGPFL